MGKLLRVTRLTANDLSHRPTPMASTASTRFRGIARRLRQFQNITPTGDGSF
jgi:hypothetical protein